MSALFIHKMIHDDALSRSFPLKPVFYVSWVLEFLWSKIFYSKLCFNIKKKLLKFSRIWNYTHFCKYISLSSVSISTGHRCPRKKNMANLGIEAPAKRASRVSMCHAPVVIHNAIPSSKFDLPYEFTKYEDNSLFRRLFKCTSNSASAEMKFR